MPDVQQENAFVDVFILPDRRERYKQLLANPRRRREFLDRLNHQLDFIPSLAIRVPGNDHTPEGVARLLHERGLKDTGTVYIFSDVTELDGLHLPLHQALEKVIEAQFGSVVCCAPGRLAYYRPEAPGAGYVLERPASPEGKYSEN